MGERFGREQTWVYLWLILVDVRQKNTNSVKQLSFSEKNKVAKKKINLDLV